jgi:pimeloyl-ACP methyl ester carboxylesterase
MNVQDMYGSPVALDHMDQFYEHLISQHKLNPKPVLEGFSRGAIYAFNWAARCPDCVAAIYNDAPVCDLCSWPGEFGRGPGSKSDWAAMLKAYEIEEEPPDLSPHNPIDNLAPLAEARVPLLHVCGSADEVVPLEENTELLAERYKRLGGHIEVIEKPGVGHHPHSLKDPTPIVEFILRSSEQP